MVTINLRDFYPWYAHDELVEVPEAVAEEMTADKRYHKAHEQRIRRNKSFYSLDAGDGIEVEAAVCYDDSPERILDLMDAGRVHPHKKRRSIKLRQRIKRRSVL